MNDQSILVEADGPVGILTLNRGDRHNAFDDVVIGEMTRGLDTLEASNDVRVVVLSAAGRSFCAGADLNWMKRVAGYSEEENLADARRLAGLMRRLNGLKKPTVARVQGAAYGGGVGLVACCDIAIAASGAHFALTEVRLGLIPAVISPYVVARIGETHARRYFLTAERFGAAEACRIGLVHEVVPDERGLDQGVGKVVAALLRNGPQAMAAAKSLVAQVAGQPVTAALIDGTAHAITRQRASAEGKEGVDAFLSKRQPSWIQE
jgi:methylglutaconyl-CoA hydratase